MFEKFTRSAISIALMLMLVTPAFTHSTTSENTAAPGLDPQRLGRIDTAINEEIAAGKIPGAVALIAHNGKLVYHKSFGFADLDSQTPMQTNSIFRIASMTKAITSVAVMVLYEQGRFRLSDPVSRYIPAFTDMTLLSGPDENGKTSRIEAKKPIRIIDLLTHSSGLSYPFIPSNVQQDYLDAGVIDGLTAKDLTLKSQMELLAKQPLMFEPGSRWAYGLSTDLLGYLVEVVSGQPLDKFFEENIFVPLAMHDSYFFLPDEKADRLVTLYADVEPGGLSYRKEMNPTSFWIIHVTRLKVPGVSFPVVQVCHRPHTITPVFAKCCSTPAHWMASASSVVNLSNSCVHPEQTLTKMAGLIFLSVFL